MKMRKILALIIALAMCISVFPARILAVNYNGVEFTALEGTVRGTNLLVTDVVGIDVNLFFVAGIAVIDFFIRHFSFPRL